MPLGLPRRVLGGRKLYDRLDLEAFASDLAYDGEVDQDGASQWDQEYRIAR
ncbi:hypothetical protein [Paracoccus sp. S-4012]|uniref:hypothetical protein n=1 Tax=Paracoccus sp. S-4012 TaxID=2665648 RepID=UPI0018A21147|nr:hypothetical protein [Paracoccus sp. S-4012]